MTGFCENAHEQKAGDFLTRLSDYHPLKENTVPLDTLAVQLVRMVCNDVVSTAEIV
jgi:hypothetical protein